MCAAAEWLQEYSYGDDWEEKQQHVDLISRYLNCRQDSSIKSAFILSFYFVLMYEEYVGMTSKDVFFNAVRQTIQQGGETSANACIVGGMMGALVGVDLVPKDMVETLLDFDCENSVGCQRPEILNVQKHAVVNIDKLIKCRPTEMLLID